MDSPMDVWMSAVPATFLTDLDEFRNVLEQL